MEIDIYALMEETDFKRMITIKKLHELTGKDLKECTNIVTPFYEANAEIQEASVLKEKFEPDSVSDILYLILEEIREGNRKLENIEDAIQEIKGSGLYNSLTDICDKIDSAKEEIQGTGLYNSITDICEKLDNLE
ncbi:MAG TPA: hypothetical protein IAC41_02880 [Candidatus Merdenecus merdavium]|nr:hypothetical protein [Candidatus Merdenecus merdavium]